MLYLENETVYHGGGFDFRIVALLSYERREHSVVATQNLHKGDLPVLLADERTESGYGYAFVVQQIIVYDFTYLLEPPCHFTAQKYAFFA